MTHEFFAGAGPLRAANASSSSAFRGVFPRPWRMRMNAISAANNCACTYGPEKFRGFARALAIISQKDALSLRLVSSSSLSG